MLAWKVPSGVALILLGIAGGLFFEGAVELAPVGTRCRPAHVASRLTARFHKGLA